VGTYLYMYVYMNKYVYVYEYVFESVHSCSLFVCVYMPLVCSSDGDRGCMLCVTVAFACAHTDTHYIHMQASTWEKVEHIVPNVKHQLTTL
jgi:hypothetical protein